MNGDIASDSGDICAISIATVSGAGPEATGAGTPGYLASGASVTDPTAGQSSRLRAFGQQLPEA